MEDLLITENELCAYVTQWQGEVVDNIKQIRLISFDGEDLLDFVNFVLKQKDVKE